MTHRQLSRHKKQQRRQRIIFFCGIAIILAVVLIVTCGWYFSEYAPMHQIVMQVYDTKIDASVFIDSLAIYGKSQGTSYLSQMASTIANQLQQNIVLRVEAEKLGITISDEEATNYLTSVGYAVTNAGIELARGALLADKVKSSYFAPQVPESANQTWVKAFMTGSEELAKAARQKIVAGGNYTTIAKEYTVDNVSISNNGDYGWHTIDILKNKLFSDNVVTYYTRPDAKAGDISEPIADNMTYKKFGYWLIRVNDRPDEESANISAVFLGSELEAKDTRARLLEGESLAAIAGNFSQYSASQSRQGELGVMNVSENVSAVFNGYAFSKSSELGVWSQPLRDESLYTKGGYWIVVIAGKEDNRPLSSTDRDTTISNRFSAWVTQTFEDAQPSIINNLNEELLNWLIAKATERIDKV